jgi:hypothetical protein
MAISQFTSTIWTLSGGLLREDNFPTVEALVRCFFV